MVATIKSIATITAVTIILLCSTPATPVQATSNDETTMEMVMVTPKKDYCISKEVRQVQPVQETTPPGNAQMVL